MDSILGNNVLSNFQSSSLVSRNITVMGKRTSVRLEPEMWTAMKEISDREHGSIHDICTLIALRKKPNTSLTAAIRVFIMLYFKSAATEEGHDKVGHGNFENMKKRARIDTKDVHYFKARDDANKAHANSANLEAALDMVAIAKSSIG